MAPSQQARRLMLWTVGPRVYRRHPGSYLQEPENKHCRRKTIHLPAFLPTPPAMPEDSSTPQRRRRRLGCNADERHPFHRVRSGSPCKTESSQKPVPMHPILADALTQWRKRCTYITPEDWVFASKRYRGRRPYWGQAILRKYIRPTAQRVGIQKRFGWHTFRHTYSTLLRSVGTEFKVMQELLRHSSFRSTLDVYTQAVTPAKHAAQAAVMSLVFSSDEDGATRVAG
jgi:hypothetical protein